MRRKVSVLLACLCLVALDAMVLVASPASAAATPPPDWSVPSPLAAPENVSQGIRAAVAPDGRALVAWWEWSTYVGYYLVQSAWYVPGSGWSPSDVWGVDDGGSTYVDVAADGQGAFFLVFRAQDATRVLAHRWTAPTGWSSAVDLNVALGGSVGPDVRVAADAGGNATVVYLCGIWPPNVCAIRYTEGVGWDGSAVTLDTSGFDVQPGIRVAASDDGSAVAMWSNLAGVGYNLQFNASFYTPGGAGWAPYTEVPEGFTLLSGHVGLSMDSAGRAATAVDISTRIAVSFHDSTGWTNTTARPSSAAGVREPAIGSSSAGRFEVAWVEFNGSGPYDYRVRGNAFADGAWGSPTNLTPLTRGDWAYAPTIASSATGKALALWTGRDGPRGLIEGAWYSDPAGWSATFALSPFGGAWAAGALASTGVALAAWSVFESPDISGVWGSSYGTGDKTPPPLSVSAPSDGAHSGNSSVLVAGATEPGATVTVAGANAGVGLSGDFALRVALAPGPNTLEVTARDAAGNSATRLLTVTYDDPAGALAADLAAAEAEVAATQAQLVAARAASNATAADLAAARTALNTTSTNLQSAQSALASLQAELTTTHAQLNATGAGTGGAPASGDSGLALALGGLGAALGAAGLAAALLKGRAARSRGGQAPAAPEKKEP